MPLRYVLTETIIKRWATKYGCLLRCRMCDGEFQVGDEIEFKNTNAAVKLPSKHYHVKCIETGSTRL